MPSISLKPGMIVLHPWHPRWGPGKVVDIDGSFAFIFFRDHLELKATRVHTQRTRLRVPDNQQDALLDRLPRATRVGPDWLLPADYRDQMARAEANELENSLHRAMRQSHMGRLAFSEVDTALGRLRLLWADDAEDRGAYDLAPAPAAPAPSPIEQDDDGWVSVAPARAPAATRSRIWWIGFTDEFAAAFRVLHRALHQDLFTSISNIARDPEPGDTSQARLLSVEVENLWCYRLGDYRLLYKPYQDQRLVVLLALGKKTSRYD